MSVLSPLLLIMISKPTATMQTADVHKKDYLKCFIRTLRVEALTIKTKKNLNSQVLRNGNSGVSIRPNREKEEKYHSSL